MEVIAHEKCPTYCKKFEHQDVLALRQLVFTADLGSVKSVALAGVPDRYVRGYQSALNRVAALYFQIFIPSHFSYGNKQDLIDWRDVMEESRRLAHEAIQKLAHSAHAIIKWQR